MTERRNAVVTGSTSGIGLGIAEALAAAGMNVMLNGFGDADQIQTHRLRIAETHGVETDYSDADMTVPEEIGAMVEKTRARFGTVDVVVNNAGNSTCRRSRAFQWRSGMPFSRSISPRRSIRPVRRSKP